MEGSGLKKLSFKRKIFIGLGFIAMLFALPMAYQLVWEIWICRGCSPPEPYMTPEGAERYRNERKSKGLSFEPRTYQEWDEYCSGNPKDTPICMDVKNGKYLGAKCRLEGGAYDCNKKWWKL
jgi:hypothetical protein